MKLATQIKPNKPVYSELDKFIPIAWKLCEIDFRTYLARSEECGRTAEKRKFPYSEQDLKASMRQNLLYIFGRYAGFQVHSEFPFNGLKKWGYEKEKGIVDIVITYNRYPLWIFELKLKKKLNLVIGSITRSDGDIRKLKAIMRKNFSSEPVADRRARCYFCYVITTESIPGQKLLKNHCYKEFKNYFEAYGSVYNDWTILDSKRQCESVNCKQWLTIEGLCPKCEIGRTCPICHQEIIQNRYACLCSFQKDVDEG